MDFDAANVIGQEGEEAISRELQLLQQEYDFQFLHDVLIVDGKQTAQIDHVVVDMYGVLVVEAKVRRGATILGADVEKSWTACYPGGANKPLQNPLAQNRQHEAVLRKALKACGESVDADHVKSVVVFSGAIISKLDLSSLERSRVIDVSGLRQFFEQRHSFAVTTPVPAAEQTRILAAIRGLDRSGDEDALRRHVAGQPYRRKGRAHSAALGRGVSASSAWSQPTVTAPVRSESRFQRRLRIMLRELAIRVAALGLLALGGWWFFFGGGLYWFSDLLASGFDSVPSQVAEPAPAAAPAGPTLEQAKAALAQSFPDIYPTVANLDSPVVGDTNGYATYTWEYVAQTADNAANVRRITLHLDDAGGVVGFAQE